MPDIPNLELFTNEEQITSKVKHRAVQVEIYNPLNGPIAVKYHQELVQYLNNTPGKPTAAGSIEFTLDPTAAAKAFEINGKTVTGADVAEWITRDYIDRRQAQLSP